MKRLPFQILSVVLAGYISNVAAQETTQPPWRANDATIIQICFDSMDRSAPDHLSAEEVTDSSLRSARPELVGFTLSDRPIYEVGLSHPIKFRSLLLQIPGTKIRAKIDAPTFLETTVNSWRYAPLPNICTDDERAGLKLVRDGQVSKTVPCPAVGLTVSFKVISSSEFSATRALNRPRGPVIYNGLKGCQEHVYKGSK